jgi:hypothetical protein
MRLIECWFSNRGYAIRSPMGDSNLKLNFSSESAPYEAAWVSLGMLMDHLHGATGAGLTDLELRLFNDSRIVDELNQSMEPLLPEQLAYFKRNDKPAFRRVTAFKVSSREIEDKINEDLK